MEERWVAWRIRNDTRQLQRTASGRGREREGGYDAGGRVMNCVKQLLRREREGACVECAVGKSKAQHIGLAVERG